MRIFIYLYKLYIPTIYYPECPRNFVYDQVAFRLLMFKLVIYHQVLKSRALHLLTPESGLPLQTCKAGEEVGLLSTSY